MDIFVSIVILNYNNYKYTLNCLKSLEEQNCKYFEVILIDNGSKISLFKKLEDFIIKNDYSFEIKLIRNKKNLYFGAGCNKGIKKAKGKYICLLNYDTIVKSDFIEKMVEFLEHHPNAGMISPKIKFYSDKRFIWNAGAFLDYQTTMVVNNRGFLEFDPNNKKYNEIQQIGFAPGTAMFLRRDIIKNVGLIDEIFMMYHEDPDWNLRAQEKGYKSFYVPTTIVYHDVPLKKQERGSALNYFFFKRNSQILVWKHANFFQFTSFYFLFIFMNFYEFLLYLFKRKEKNILLQIEAIIRGFRIGLRRKTNRICNQNLLNDYYFLKKIKNENYNKFLDFN